MTNADIKRIIAALAERWPRCFSQKRPIKIGIHADIVAAGGFTADEVAHALRYYVGKPSYLEAMAKGGDRIDLDGNIAGQVTEAQTRHAVELYAARQARSERHRTAKLVAQKKQPRRLSLADLKVAAQARNVGLR
jgi:sRNA-binding protein